MEKIRAVYRIPNKQLKKAPDVVSVVEDELFQHIGILMKKEGILTMTKDDGAVDDQTEFKLDCVVMTIDEWKGIGSKIRKAIMAPDNKVNEILGEINEAFLSVKR